MSDGPEKRKNENVIAAAQEEEEKKKGLPRRARLNKLLSRIFRLGTAGLVSVGAVTAAHEVGKIRQRDLQAELVQNAEDFSTDRIYDYGQEGFGVDPLLPANIGLENQRGNEYFGQAEDVLKKDGRALGIKETEEEYDYDELDQYVWARRMEEVGRQLEPTYESITRGNGSIELAFADETLRSFAAQPGLAYAYVDSIIGKYEKALADKTVDAERIKQIESSGALESAKKLRQKFYDIAQVTLSLKTIQSRIQYGIRVAQDSTGGYTSGTQVAESENTFENIELVTSDPNNLANWKGWEIIGQILGGMSSSADLEFDIYELQAGLQRMIEPALKDHLNNTGTHGLETVIEAAFSGQVEDVIQARENLVQVENFIKNYAAILQGILSLAAGAITLKIFEFIQKTVEKNQVGKKVRDKASRTRKKLDEFVNDLLGKKDKSPRVIQNNTSRPASSFTDRRAKSVDEGRKITGDAPLTPDAKQTTQMRTDEEIEARLKVDDDSIADFEYQPVSGDLSQVNEGTKKS